MKESSSESDGSDSSDQKRVEGDKENNKESESEGNHANSILDSEDEISASEED